MSVLVSNYLRDGIFTDIDGGYLALYTSNPGADNSGDEVTGGDYARKQIDLQGTGATRTNDAEIRFDGLPEGDITHFGILDASTAGNLLVYGALSSTAPIPEAGGELVFSIGTVSLELN
jgi:hypothetical protein